jgi:hypothetical protein
MATTQSSSTPWESNPATLSLIDQSIADQSINQSIAALSTAETSSGASFL